MIPGSCSLDTSVVLRLLVGDPIDQFQSATRFLKEQLEAQAAVHVSDHVLAEAYFALQCFYKIPKAEALEMLCDFGEASGVTVTLIAREILALPNLASAKPGFVDRLIHGDSHAAGRTLVTFEKAAKKLVGTVVLPAS
jgi:predicted nucleic-acid-binding protein